MAKKQRVPHDVLHRQAQLEVLGAMVRGEDLDGLTAAVAPSEVPNWFTPDVAVLELAVTALELATPAGTDRLVYEGLRERYLPEVQFRGRTEHRSSQYALYAAAAMRGGVEPDLLNDTGWWQTRLWTYAVCALLIYARVAAERNDTTVEQIAQDIAARHQLTADLSASGSNADSEVRHLSR
jgi:hypothetical protein